MRLRLVNGQPFHQPTKFLPAELPRLRLGAWPLEIPAFHALVQQDETVAFPKQGLDSVTALSAKQKQAIGKRVKLKLFSYDSGQTVNTATHIGIPTGQIHGLHLRDVT